MLSALHQRSGYTTAYVVDPLAMDGFEIDQRRLSSSCYMPKTLRRSLDGDGPSDSDSNSDSVTHSCSDMASTRSPASFCNKHLVKKLSINDKLRSVIGEIITEEELQHKFTFGRLLGSGATSKVYSAIDNATGVEVAVKVFDKAAMIEVRRSMVADGAFVKEKAVHRVRRRLHKILSELEICRSLDHPNIIKYLGAYETSHRLCIVHELVDGGDLLEHLLQHGKMAEHQAAKVFYQLLQALQYCHARHIYHRDLKLENVLVTKDMQVKLIDFGLSEIVMPGETLKTICGTPLYCSPEVLFMHSSARELGFFGGPADVWSVGILIFALLTGCAPFDDSNFTRLRHDVHRNRIAYPSYLSNEAKGLLKTLLIFDPHMRPTVSDILEYPWIQRGDTKPSTCSNPASPLVSLTVAKTRSLSGSSDRDTDTTTSSSNSFEDDAECARATEPLSKIAAEPHDHQTKQQVRPTHLSCLERELEQLLATSL